VCAVSQAPQLVQRFLPGNNRPHIMQCGLKRCIYVCMFHRQCDLYNIQPTVSMQLLCHNYYRTKMHIQ